MKFKRTTTTLLVEEALREAERTGLDFMDIAMLMKKTGRGYREIHAALYNLRKYRVIDVVINPDGHAWWMALPPEEDTRIRKREEQAPVGPKAPHRRAAKPLGRPVHRHGVPLGKPRRGRPPKAKP